MGRMVKSLVLGLMLVCFMGLQAIAQTADDDAARGPDRACLRCHNTDGKMEGLHSKATSPNSNERVSCVSCHGNIGANHREGEPDVMKFTPGSTFKLDQRNGVCLSCHEIPDITKKMWAHNIHATRAFCTDCHQVHPADDPMKKLTTDKSRIKLCVDCHGKLHEEKKKTAQGAQ